MPKLIHIPFAKGQNEAADPKLLPAGLLREAVNVRLRADGRLGCRYGYDEVGVDVVGDSAVVPHDLGAFGDQQILYASGDRTLVRVESAGGSWKALDDSNAAARSLRVLNRADPVARPPLQNQSRGADVAVNTAGWACLCWTVPRGAGLDAVVLVVRVGDGAVLCHQRIDATADAEAVRVVALGTVFYLLHVDSVSHDLECWTLDTASAVAFTLASAQLVDTADIHDSYEFDARANGASEFVVGWRKSATEISWENFNAALATVGTRQTVTANGKLSIDAINNGVVAIVNITSAGAVECRTWNEATQALINTTTVDAGTDAVGQPWIELASATAAMVTWGATAAGVNATHPEWNYRSINPTTHALGTLGSVNGARPASGSFLLPSGDTGLWVVDTDSIERGYTLVRFGARTPEPEGQIEKPTAATAAIVGERRSKVVALGGGAYVWAALALPPNADPTAASLDTLPVLYRFEVEQQTRVRSARLGGCLYLAGGLVTVFDGARYYEQDWCSTPVFDELLPQTGSGDLISETIYTYARVLEWVDAQGQRLFSAPSTPVQATLAAGNNQVRMELSPPFTRKLDAAMGGASINDIIYRSKSDGITLRELTRLKWLRGDTTPQVVTDATDDCGCDGKPLIYTQGSRGAVSGPLQNDSPNACEFIWAGRDRIMIGRRDGVQWSLRKSESEAVGWSNSDSFKKRIADVTGVASLDERWIVFTSDGVYEITGPGPDDDGLQGEFSAPRRLPAEGGCVDSRCLVEVSAGLIYQQAPDRLYLLPRGGGAPFWFSQAVRATLARYPVITSGVYCRVDNTVAFTCNAQDGLSGVVVVHDMRSGDWYVDELDGLPPVRGASAWSGLHAICGASFVRVQTTAFADAGGEPIPVRVKLGAIRPFGISAWGMIHTLTVLAEYRDACTVGMRFSFDDGATFTTATPLVQSGKTPGDAVRLQWTLPRTRTDHIVVELTITSLVPSEGLALNAITLEVEAAEGPPRVRAADRA